MQAIGKNMPGSGSAHLLTPFEALFFIHYIRCNQPIKTFIAG